jgi:hypothetical protein
MIGEDIKLVGQFIDHETSHKDWWSEYQKGQQFALQIKKKNAEPLKEIYKKMYDDGIHYLRLHFEGGHDEGGFDDNFQYLDCDKIDMDIKDISKYEPTGWIITYIPLIHETKIKKQNITQVFEYPKTDYSNFKLTDNWLREKWYDFGFLEEWGSFAFEGHVSGDVTVSTKDGTYEIDAQESHEQWESKSNSGTMFMEK